MTHAANQHPFSRFLLQKPTAECTFPECPCPVDSHAECPVAAPVEYDHHEPLHIVWEDA
jgi:hypothetical protein